MNISSSLKRKAKKISEHLLSNKSKEWYIEVYEKCLVWLSEDNVMLHELNDDILLIDLPNLSKINKSKHALYSMVKTRVLAPLPKGLA